jgi:hypothetical protein
MGRHRDITFLRPHIFEVCGAVDEADSVEIFKQTKENCCNLLSI